MQGARAGNLGASWRARRVKQDKLQTHKLLRSASGQSQNDLLVKNNRQIGAATRSSTDPWSLMVPRARLEIRKHSFAVRAPETWNKLPAEIRTYEEPKQFKKALKNINIGLGGGPPER